MKLINLLFICMFVFSCTSTGVKYFPETRECITFQSINPSINIKEDIMFDWDKSEIRYDQTNILDSIIKRMNENPELNIMIEGYASIEGDIEYNLNLSFDRSTNVKNYLIQNGIYQNRIVKNSGKGATSIFGDNLNNNRKVIVLSLFEK